MLKAENLNVYYGKSHALKDVSFEVNDGEIIALIGANGAGKSTTLKTLSGILHSRGGKTTFCDENITHVESYKLLAKGLAHVPEGRRIFLQMTVQENLEMGAYICKKFSRADLEDAFNRFPRLRERALMSHPKLLMLDEPSMGLAPILVQQIFDIITELHKAGTTILLVEQNAEMALQIADRAYVLESGRITLSGTGEELMQSDSIKKAYLGG